MIINDESRSLKIKVDYDGTIKGLLEDQYKFSLRLIRKLKKENRILLNNKPVPINQEIHIDDNVEVLFEKERVNYDPEDMELDILYEDGDLLILNKKPNIVVHPTKSHFDGTLANGIANYFIKNKIKKKVRFINRLDMNTSGIILIAKTSYGHQYIQEQMETNTITKGYKAIIINEFPYDSGTISYPMGKEKKGDIQRKILDNGKSAITEFKIDQKLNNGALVDIKLITGRTHQIRVHFSYLGNPLLGDTLYGETSEFIDRQALHSYYIRLKPPRKDNFIEIYSKLPKDMEDAIEKMGGMNV